MKRFLAHTANVLGCTGVIAGASKLITWIIEKLFGGFLGDEAYASEHPKKYLAGFIGIYLLMVGTCVAVLHGVMYTAVWIATKIEGHFKKDEEEDEFE